MNVLLLAPELFRAEGGVARILRLYLKALGELAGPGGRVDVVVLNDAPGDDARLARYLAGNPGERAGCRRRKALFAWHALRLAARADLLVCGHVHLLTVAAFARLIHPRLRCCLVAHGIDVWRPYGPLERRALLATDRILCVSEFTRRQMIRFLPALAPGRLVVVPNGLDPFFSASAPSVPAAVGSSPRLLAVTRLTAADRYKGVDTLIEALLSIRRQHPGARLRLVGGGDDVPFLRALAAAGGVADAVDFLGVLSDEELRAEYAACDVFALPSRREGFGLVYLEAMTHGKPCVGARAGGTPEVIGDTVGRLVDYGNVPDLAAAVGEIGHRPPESGIVRRHTESFAYPAFRRRLAAALA